MSKTATRVTIVHGLWMGAWAMRPLAAKLAAAGYQPSLFSYPTRTRGIERNAQALAEHLRQNFGSEPARLVGHSLGGVVALHAMQMLGELAGSAVLLGSPINGSATAERFSDWPGAKALLGEARKGLTTGSAPKPSEAWEVRMIAGTRRLGLGVLVSAAGEPGDGTVAVYETQADWLVEHRVMPETHSSMLMSRAVADQVIGWFD